MDPSSPFPTFGTNHHGRALGRERTSPLQPFHNRRRPSVVLHRKPKPVFTRGPKRLQHDLLEKPPTPYPPKPAGFIGTEDEWAIYWAHTKLGLRPEQDFHFQSSLLGGRLDLGGLVLDFEEFDLFPRLGINVQGIHWHYEIGSGKIARDQLQRLQLANRGIQLIWIDEDDALRDPIYYLKQARMYIDHSRGARIGY